MAKAFDFVPYFILISKLHFYGVRSIELNLFKRYLFDPQGSVLGPLLFLMMTNEDSKCILFAGDTTFYTSDNNDHVLRNVAKHSLNQAAHWFQVNDFV